MKTFMKTKEVAELLRVDPKTLMHLIKTERLPLPYITVGKQIRFRGEAVEKLLEGNPIQVEKIQSIMETKNV